MFVFMYNSHINKHIYLLNVYLYVKYTGKYVGNVDWNYLLDNISRLETLLFY